MGVAVLCMLGRGAEAAHRFPGIAGAGRLASFLGDGATAPQTTSMGRLFDAASALLGLRLHQTYEGQAAMELEALVNEPANRPGGYVIRDNTLDVTPLLGALLAPGLTAQDGASLFHGTLIAGLADWVSQNASASGSRAVVLAGGCFANRILAEGLPAALRERQLIAYLPRALPCNDGGLAFGQAVIGRAHLAAGRRISLDQPACA